MRIAATGTFDGVHLGHRFLLDRLVSLGRERALEPLVLTFDRHPLSVIRPEAVPPALTSPAERRRLLEEAGVRVEVLKFDNDLRRLTGAEFLGMLRERLDVGAFMFGFNNRIGSDRAGADTPGLSAAAGVELFAAPECGGLAASSSAIRSALAEGNVEAANAMLGRPYEIEGEIVGGRRLGRTIGFPTANFSVSGDRMLPAPGVYAGRVLGHRAVVNIGRRPTVEGRYDAPLSVEAHLLGFDGDLYGRVLGLEFLKRLRGEVKFGSLDELKAAIAGDVEETKRFFADAGE